MRKYGGCPTRSLINFRWVRLHFVFVSTPKPDAYVKLAHSVAKSIELKRTHFEQRAQVCTIPSFLVECGPHQVLGVGCYPGSKDRRFGQHIGVIREASCPT